eukprot:sb/3464016/
MNTLECQRLKRLYLDVCEEHGCQPLKPVLRLFQGRNGTKLYLRGNLLNEVSWEIPSNAQLLTFAKYLKADTLITEIDMSFNSLQEETCMAIGLAIATNRQLKRLKMVYCQMDPLENTESPECQRLKKLYFEACEEHGCFHLDPLVDILEGHSPHGTRLILRGNMRMFRKKALTDSDFLAMAMVLRTDTFITHLDLSYNSLSDAVCVGLGEAIAKNKTLKHLNLSMCDLSVDGCFAICKGLEFNYSITHVNMSGNSFGRDGSVELAATLQLNNTITHLYLGSTHQTAQSVIPVCTVVSCNGTGIQHLDLSRTIPPSDPEVLGEHVNRLLVLCNTLTSLRLAKCDLTDVCVKIIAPALVQNVTLTSLDLSCNKISSDGAKTLAEVLRANQTLLELKLCSNRIEDEGTVALGLVLSSGNDTLKKLWITNNSVTGRGLSSLANALQFNMTLSHVYIWGNALDNMACNAFSHLLVGEKPRLRSSNVDIKPYVVDGVNFLAEQGRHGFSH